MQFLEPRPIRKRALAGERGHGGASARISAYGGVLVRLRIVGVWLTERLCTMQSAPLLLARLSLTAPVFSARLVLFALVVVVVVAPPVQGLRVRGEGGGIVVGCELDGGWAKGGGTLKVRVVH